MKRRHRKPAPPERSQPRRPDPGLPSVEILEEFTQVSLAKWRAAGRDLEQLSRQMFFGLEARRSTCSAELIDAIREASAGPRQFKRWARIVDYRYTNKPLSMAGSLKGDGGRFNIGASLNPATSTPFPALYVAEDFPTAFRERFGVEEGSSAGPLTAMELVLRKGKGNSFSHVELNAHLETFIDVGDLAALRSVASILARLQMPAGIAPIARRLKLRVPGLVRSASMLQRQLLDPSWRADPVQHGLPSNSQVFGRLCAAAGVHGILFPSVRNSHRQCLALFPQNWRGSTSAVELLGPCPPEVESARLDGNSTPGDV